MKPTGWISQVAPGTVAAVGLCFLALAGEAPNWPAATPRQAAIPPARRNLDAAALRPGGRLASLGEALNRARYGVEPAAGQPAAFTAANPAQALRARFRPGQVELAMLDHGPAGERQVRLRTVAMGRGFRRDAITPGPVKARENRVEYAHRTARGAAVTEWWVNAPEGVEQGFTIPAAPEGATPRAGQPGEGKTASPPAVPSLHPLTVEVAVEGSLRPTVTPDGQAVELQDAIGQPVLRAAALKAWDATGRELPITWQSQSSAKSASLQPSSLLLQVNDAGAVYPVTIDPTFTQVQKFTAPLGDAATGDNFGGALAVDGDTAVVGAINDSPDLGSGPINRAGAAYVFTRTGGVWSFQQKLTEPADDALPVEVFGNAVAVDGDTLVVGASSDTVNVGGPTNTGGAAYVFTRSSGTWTLERKLRVEPPTTNLYFGTAVAVEGDTVVVGSLNRDVVAVYTRDGGAWTEQQLIIPPIPDFAFLLSYGYTLALDGDTLAVGAPYSHRILDTGAVSQAGLVYVYRRSSGVWSLEQRLGEEPGDAADFEYFGWSLALDGDTLAVGANGETVDPGTGPVMFAGAAYVFTRTGGVWTEQQKLTEPPAEVSPEYFGYAVALEGKTLAVGIPGETVDLGNGPLALAGAVSVFTESGGVWTRRQKATAAPGDIQDNAFFGISLGLEGGTLLAGAQQHSPDLGAGPVNHAGAVFILNAPPNTAPVAQADKTLIAVTNTVTGLGITAPTDADSDPLAITVDTVPIPGKGVVRKAGGGAILAAGDPLTTAELTSLEFHPAADQTGAAGTFSYTVADGNGGSVSQTITLQISSITLTAPSTGTTGLPVMAEWTAPPGQSAVDWVGFFRADVPGPAGYLSWVWTGGKTTGSFTAVPRTPGTYVFRYYLNDGGTLAAVSDPIVVSDPPAAEFSVTLSPASANPGDAVTVSWSAPAGRPATDWIGLYVTGTPGPAGYLTWFYTGGTQTGSKSLPAPGSAGTYVARYYLQDGGALATTSNTLEVTSSTIPYTVTPGATTVATGGTLTVSWTAPAGRPAVDWVALVRADQVQAGPPPVITGYVNWAYTGGTTSGSTQFSLTGVVPGTYQVAYLLNDSFTVGALGATVTVMP